LARPPDLLEMLRAKASDHPYDPEAFAERVGTAVAEVVRQQIDLKGQTQGHGRGAPTGEQAALGLKGAGEN
jgi:hypothetical protein